MQIFKNHLGSQGILDGIQNVTKELTVLKSYETTLLKKVEGKGANRSHFGNE